MEFFAKAAALALSVLASIFTNVEAPEAQAKAAPVASQVSQQRPQQAKYVVYCSNEASKDRQVTLVVFKPLAQTSLPDPESVRFLEWIGRAQNGSKPLAVRPWYANTDPFNAPSIGESADILRTLLTGGHNDQ